jgi:hypothetical protein
MVTNSGGGATEPRHRWYADQRPLWGWSRLIRARSKLTGRTWDSRSPSCVVIWQKYGLHRTETFANFANNVIVNVCERVIPGFPPGKAGQSEINDFIDRPRDCFCTS